MALSKIVADSVASNAVTTAALSDSGVTAGSYGNTTAIPVITVDAKGRITSATTNSVSGVTGVSFAGANNTLTVSTSTTDFSANINASLNTTYSNATSYADTKAAAAYTNAVAYAASNTYVNSTFAPLSGATYTGAVSGITTLAAGNTTITGTANVTANLTANNVRTYGSVQIDGDLIVSGNTVQVNVTNLSLEDNMIYLNANNTVSHPDLGIAGNYNDGTYKHAGFFRDATDARWKFFDSYTPEPDASAYIDTANTSFRIADLEANVIYGATFTGTANNASYFGGQLPAYYANATAPGTAYSNAVAYAAANTYVNTQLALKANLTGASFTGQVNIASAGQVLTLNRNDGSPASLYFQSNGTLGGLMGTDGTAITFYNSSGAELSRMAANGNVGIGNTSPAQALHISRSDNSLLYITSLTGQAGIKMWAGSDATNRATRIDFFNGVASNTTPRWVLINDYNQSGTNDFQIVDASLNKAFVIRQGGSIGVGTESPVTRMHIKADTAAADSDGVLVVENGMNNGYETMKLYATGGYNATMSFRSNNYWLGMGLDQTDSGKFKINTDNLLNVGNNLITITQGGSVGLGGVTSPSFGTVDTYAQRGIHISGNKESGTAPVIRLTETGSGKGNFEIRSNRKGTTSGNVLVFGEGDDGLVYIRGDDDGGTTSTRGFMGIGTIDPTTSLTISKPIDSSAYGAGTRVIDFKTYYPGYDVDTVKASIYAGVSDQGSLNTQGGYLAIYTANNGSLGERLRVEKNGQLWLGKGSVGGDNQKFKIGNHTIWGKLNDDLYIYGYGGETTGGLIYAGNYYTFSNRNLKENIELLEDPLTKLLQIEGVSYNIKDTGRKSIGVLADQVAAVYPDLVTYNEDGEPDSVDYPSLVAVLIEAVRTLKNEIDLLKAK
jgi:Chaperone of endosialidase